MKKNCRVLTTNLSVSSLHSQRWWTRETEWRIKRHWSHSYRRRLWSQVWVRILESMSNWIQWWPIVSEYPNHDWTIYIRMSKVHTKHSWKQDWSQFQRREQESMRSQLPDIFDKKKKKRKKNEIKLKMSRKERLTWTKKRLWIRRENIVSTMTLTIFWMLNPRWLSGRQAEAMSWNQIAFTTLDRKKNGRTHKAPKVTVNIGSNQLHTKDGDDSKCTRYLSEGINP